MNDRPKQNAFTLIELLVVVGICIILAAIAVPNFLEAQTRSKVARVKADMRNLAVAVELYHVDCNAYPSMTRHLALINEHLSHDDDWHHSFNNFMRYDGDGRYGGDMQYGSRCPCLTTPVAYLSSPPPPDPFIGQMALAKTGSYTKGHNGRINCSFFFYNFKGAARKRKNDPDFWALYLAPVIAPAPMRFNGPGGPVYQAEWAMLSPGPDRTFQVNDPAGGVPWVSYQFFYDHHNWEGMLEGRHCLYDPTNGSTSAGDIWRTSQGIIQ